MRILIMNYGKVVGYYAPYMITEESNLYHFYHYYHYYEYQLIFTIYHSNTATALRNVLYRPS